MPEMKSIATNCMPEVASGLPYDFKKILESPPQVASQPLLQPYLSGNPSKGFFSYQYVYRLSSNI
jgi:hypothetical protein